MRIFLAIDLNPPIRSGIAAIQDSLAREGIREIRWVNPGGVHLTLHFCGEISGETVERLSGAMAPGVPVRPFAVGIGGLGTFPPRGAPRVLFVAAREADPLLKVAGWVEDRVASAGLPREARPFHPHLTLGRFRPGARPPDRGLLEAPAARDLGMLPVDRVTMFRSHLEPGGARYEALHQFPLLGPAGGS